MVANLKVHGMRKIFLQTCKFLKQICTIHYIVLNVSYKYNANRQYCSLQINITQVMTDEEYHKVTLRSVHKLHLQIQADGSDVIRQWSVGAVVESYPYCYKGCTRSLHSPPQPGQLFCFLTFFLERFTFTLLGDLIPNIDPRGWHHDL